MRTQCIIRLHHWYRLSALLMLTALIGQVCAQDNQVNFSVRGRWPGFKRGPASDVAVQGHYAYVGVAVGDEEHSGPRDGWILVFDVTDPAKPVYRSTFEAGRGITSLRIAGNYLLAARGKEGLLVVDITRPDKPTMAGVLQSCYNEHVWPQCIRVSGDYAYVVSCGPFGDLKQWFGLDVVDIRNPSQPALTGRVAIPAQIGHLEVSGTYAYVPGYRAGLFIIDASNPKQPVCVGPFPNWGGLAIAGHYAYTPIADVYTAILDLSNPTNPTPVTVLFTNLSNIQCSGTNLFAVTPEGLQVFDITDPTRLVWVGKSEGPELGPYQLAGDYAYALCDGMLQVIQLTDRTHPTRLDRVQIQGGATVVRVNGNHAYFADSYGLHVLDVSDPGHPLLLGSVKTKGTLTYITLDRFRPYVYSAEDPWGDGSRMRVYDVRNPTTPVRVGESNLRSSGGACWRMRCSGNHVFIAGHAADFNPGPYPAYIGFDVSNPTQPVETLGLPLGTGEARVLEIEGDYLYVPFYTPLDGVPPTLYVLDVRNPRSPVIVGAAFLQPTTDTWAIDVSGRYAYAGTGEQFEVFDVAHPANPVSVGACATGFVYWLRFLQVEGQYAYVAGYRTDWDQLWLQVVDVRDPTQPELLKGTYEVRLSGYSMDEPYQAVGNLIYLADEWGLTILEVELPGTMRLQPPVLSGDSLILTWNGGSGIKLQKTISLASPDWQDVPGSDGVSQLTLPRTDSAAFFRLHKP